MAAIMTGAKGTLAYWDGATDLEIMRAFGPDDAFSKPEVLSFAGLSAFAENGNHPPAGFEGAVTWDAGIDLLFRIAGAR